MLQDFPISEDKLIELAKKLHETGTGVKDGGAMLAPDFRCGLQDAIRCLPGFQSPPVIRHCCTICASMVGHE